MKDIKVKKTNGELEPFDPEKMHEKVIMSCQGITGVSASEIMMNANLQLSDGIESRAIQSILIKSAADLISEEDPNYQYVAGNLLNQQIRKEVYGQYNPKDFYESVKQRVQQKIYDPILIKEYTKEEIEYFGKKIKFSKDDEFTYAGLEQLYKSYLVSQNKKIKETPQESFMLIQMTAFASYPKEERKKWILEGYKILSENEVSLPTPIMNGVRTPFKRFISCNGVDYGDSTESISNANAAVTKLTASKSGLGLGLGSIRGLGADIDNGRVKHTGIVPIARGAMVLTKSFTQQSRGGSSTMTYPFFHIEIEDLVVLKNNKGTEDNRVRHADHSFAINEFLMKRVQEDKDITLFFMNDVPGLYQSFYDNDLFTALYEKYERTVPKKNQKKIKARDVIKAILSERFGTGRIYTMNLDHMNSHSTYKLPILFSNLCQEIALPASPLDYNYKRPEVQKDLSIVYKETNPEIFVCILASVNAGIVKKERIPIVTEYLVRFLDALIDYQDYAMPEVEFAAKKRRSLGIGISDWFHFLAKNKVIYNTEEARNLTHEFTESVSYYLHKASIKLAKEFGACELYKETKYSDGEMPIDNYTKSVDELVSVSLQHDWEELRIELKEYGIRNSSLMAIAPTASSAIVGNNTAGVEPPRELVKTKTSGNMIIKQVVPEFQKLKHYYTTAWSPEFNNTDYFKMIAVFQKFIDQSISTNQYTDLTRYPGGMVPFNELLQEFKIARKYGLKTLYYQNFYTNDSKNEEPEGGCAGGGCTI